MGDLERISAAIDRMTERQHLILTGYIEGYADRVKEENEAKEARRRAREKKKVEE